jgi:hypothetical protein
MNRMNDELIPLHFLSVLGPILIDPTHDRLNRVTQAKRA